MQNIYSKNYEDYLRRLHENVFIMTARWNGTSFELFDVIIGVSDGFAIELHVTHAMLCYIASFP